ncbi:MAG: hypothetical protein NC131_05520 [Roseburia sp.]|nr:hypothetical protein [Roseburia sp.]
MRKLRGVAVLLFTASAALLIIFLVATLPDRLLFRGGDRYTFYVGNTSKDCRVITCSADEADVKRLTLQDVCGESATYKSLDITAFLSGVNGEILFSEQLDDSVNYYCKADLPYSVLIDGLEINLHICVREEGVTVASPIIFGGY